jgi:aminoglycoside 6'-N-acetyltransferase
VSGFPESGGPEVGFLPLGPDDPDLQHLGLLHGWLQQPHVRAFWDDGERTLQQVQEHYLGADQGGERFVLTLDGRAAGYVQAYAVGPAADFARWRSDIGDTWGMDLLLGEAADTGRGWGPQAIRAFVQFWRQRHPGLRRMLADPDMRNRPAVRAYQRAGFSVLDEHLADPERLLILALNL